MTNPNDTQIGGEHYKKYPIQPWDYIMKNNIPWAEGCIIEWVTRWRDKGGVQDLEKAKHMIEKIISGCDVNVKPQTKPHDIMPVYPDVRIREFKARNIAKETTDPLCDSESRVSDDQRQWHGMI